MTVCQSILLYSLETQTIWERRTHDNSCLRLIHFALQFVSYSLFLYFLAFFTSYHSVIDSADIY